MPSELPRQELLGCAHGELVGYVIVSRLVHKPLFCEVNSSNDVDEREVSDNCCLSSVHRVTGSMFVTRQRSIVDGIPTAVACLTSQSALPVATVAMWIAVATVQRCCSMSLAPIYWNVSNPMYVDRYLRSCNSIFADLSHHEN